MKIWKYDQKNILKNSNVCNHDLFVLLSQKSQANLLLFGIKPRELERQALSPSAWWPGNPFCQQRTLRSRPKENYCHTKIYIRQHLLQMWKSLMHPRCTCQNQKEAKSHFELKTEARRYYFLCTIRSMLSWEAVCVAEWPSKQMRNFLIIPSVQWLAPTNG